MLKIIYSNPKTIEWYGEMTKVYVGDNNFNYIEFNFPDKIESFPRSECSVELRAYTTKEHYLSYSLSTEKNNVKHPIALDMTDASRTLKLLLVITHNETVIGFTNALNLNIHDSGGGSEISPREGLDRTIAEQAATITRQETEIATKDNTISQQGEQITELNSEVTELSTENTRLEALTDTQRETIQSMLDNPPQPKLYTPPVVTPSGSVQQINPPTGYDGLSNAVVDRVTAEVDSDIQPENIKEGVDILGVEGTYDPFPEHSVGGIYITEVDEDGYPVKFLVKDWKKAPETFPQFFDISASAVRSLRTIIFENCPSIKYFSQSCFSPLQYLKNIILPENLAAISQYCFQSPCGIEEIVFPSSVLEIVQRAFQQNRNLISVRLNSGILSISSYAFLYCGNLKTINLPNSLTYIAGDAFTFCNHLENVTIENGFNCNNLNLSSSTLYSHDTILSWFNALADRTGETAYTLTIGSTNLNKMTAEEKAIATNKNWNIA